MFSLSYSCPSLCVPHKMHPRVREESGLEDLRTTRKTSLSGLGTPHPAGIQGRPPPPAGSWSASLLTWASICHGLTQPEGPLQPLLWGLLECCSRLSLAIRVTCHRGAWDELGKAQASGLSLQDGLRQSGFARGRPTPTPERDILSASSLCPLCATIGRAPGDPTFPNRGWGG